MSSTNKYQALITQLEKNDPSFVYLDFENIDLTILQLEEIASKIILNNQNYKQYPNDFIHGLLSLHIYVGSKTLYIYLVL